MGIGTALASAYDSNDGSLYVGVTLGYAVAGLVFFVKAIFYD
jgi:hypothetical protein